MKTMRTKRSRRRKVTPGLKGYSNIPPLPLGERGLPEWLVLILLFVFLFPLSSSSRFLTPPFAGRCLLPWPTHRRLRHATAAAESHDGRAARFPATQADRAR